MDRVDKLPKSTCQTTITKILLLSEHQPAPFPFTSHIIFASPLSLCTTPSTLQPLFENLRSTWAKYHKNNCTYSHFSSIQRCFSLLSKFKSEWCQEISTWQQWCNWLLPMKCVNHSESVFYRSKRSGWGQRWGNKIKQARALCVRWWHQSELCSVYRATDKRQKSAFHNRLTSI